MGCLFAFSRAFFDNGNVLLHCSHADAAAGQLNLHVAHLFIPVPALGILDVPFSLVAGLGVRGAFFPFFGNVTSFSSSDSAVCSAVDGRKSPQVRGVVSRAVPRDNLP